MSGEKYEDMYHIVHMFSCINASSTGCARRGQYVWIC